MNVWERLLGRKPYKETHVSSNSILPQAIHALPNFCVCKGCNKEIVFVLEKMVHNGTIYCSECTMKTVPIEKYFSGTYEVFAYTFPWNPAIKAYSRGPQWLPTYQAETGGLNLDRRVKREAIPSGYVFASITLAISQHGSFTYYEDVDALISIRKDFKLICAYVPEEVFRNRFRII